MSKNVRNDLNLIVSSLTINNVIINTPNNASYTLTLPSNTGTNGQVLTTNGSGVLSWTTVVVGGGGTVTSVAATVPTFLSATVVNPTTTPSVNITLSGTALPTGNGGTGVTAASTGTGGVVLSIKPTITSSDSVAALTLTGASTGIANILEIMNPSAISSSGAEFRLGRILTESARFRYIHDTTATLRTLRISVNTGVFLLSGDTAIASTLNTPLSLPSMTLTTTPLATSSGGTGLSVVGTSGQYLSSNGSTLSWVSPSAGTGSVISVSLSVDPSLSGLFTNTGVATVTTSGTFTLTRVTNPTIGGNVTFSGDVAVTGTTTLTIPLSVTSGGTGVTSSTGTGANVLSNSPTLVTPVIGAAIGTSLSVTGQLTSTVASGTPPLVVSSITNVPNLNASSLNGGTFASPGAIGSTVASTGAFTTLSLTTPLPTASGGTGTTAFTGTGSNVLATSPTLVTPVIGVATGTSLSVSGQLTSTVVTGTPPLVVSSTTNVPNLNASSLNGATFASPGAIGGTVASTGAFTTLSISTPLPIASGGTGTNSFTGTGANVFSTSPTLVTPVIGTATGTSLSLSTPLNTTSGGTGLSTVGSNGQVLTVNGGVPTWLTPSSPGTGTVTLVGLTIDSSLSGMFTNTGTVSPITGSGTYILSQSASPAVVMTGANFMTVSNSATTSQGPFLVLMPNMGNTTTLTTWFGKASLFNGSAGVLQYNRGTTDIAASNSFVMGIGTGSYLTLTNGNGATLTGSLTTTGVFSGTSITASNGTTTTTNVANDLSVIISTGNSPTITDIETFKTSNTALKQTLALNRFGGAVTVGSGGLTIATPLGVASGGTGVGTSSGTGSVVLNNAPTLFNPILSGNLPVDSISFPAVSGPARISLFGVASNANEFDGFSSGANTLRYQVNTSSNNHIFYSSINSSSSLELFRVKGTGGFTATGASQVTGSLAVTAGATITGTSTFSGPVNMPELGFMVFTMSGNFGIANNTNTTVGNFVVSSGIGNQITLSTGDTFTNNLLGRAITVILSWSTKLVATTSNLTTWVETNAGATRYGITTAAGDQSNCCSAIFRVADFGFFVLRGFQNSGFGQDFSASTTVFTMTIF